MRKPNRGGRKEKKREQMEEENMNAYLSYLSIYSQLVCQLDGEFICLFIGDKLQNDSTKPSVVIGIIPRQLIG